MRWYICGGQRTTFESWFAPSTMWVPVIKLRSTDMVADALLSEPLPWPWVAFSHLTAEVLFGSLVFGYSPSFPLHYWFKALNASPSPCVTLGCIKESALWTQIRVPWAWGTWALAWDTKEGTCAEENYSLNAGTRRAHVYSVWDMDKAGESCHGARWYLTILYPD